MGIYFMFGKYSVNSVRQASAERTKKAAALVKKCGGQVKAVYALLGEHDIVCIADFPSTKEAMKASVELTRLLDIAFTTAPAVTVDEFDKLIKKK
jgi:uncharacterized protein with GYD domain